MMCHRQAKTIRSMAFIGIILAMMNCAAVPSSLAFQPPINPIRKHSLLSVPAIKHAHQLLRVPTTACRRRPVPVTATTTPLFSAPSPLPDTTDPFILLGLDPKNPTADKKEIKRAYKRQAMKYHPDVVISAESSPEERRRASEEFARINAAYEILSGKGSGGVGVDTKTGRRKASPNSTGRGSGSWAYQPPHRRTSGGNASSTSGGASTDWRDYMPNYDEEDSKYDAGDDSFSKIFSDLMTGVAAGAVGAGVNIIDFLEGNVDGFASGSYEDDDTLTQLLLFGSLDDVANEMDDTQLLVTQLETKLDNMIKDVTMIKEEVRRSMYESVKFAQKIELEERLAEIEARKGVVGNYLKKARKRLVKIQARYKELIVAGRADSRAGRGGYYSDNSSSRASSSYGSSSRDTGYGASTAGRSSPSSSNPSPERAQAPSSSPSPAATDDDSRSFSRTEGFGSFGRRGGRGTSRSRRRSRGADSSEAVDSSTSPAAAPPPSGRPEPSYASTTRPSPSSSPYRSSPSPSPSPASRSSTSSSSRSRSSSIASKKEWTPPIPPHRRTGPDPRQVADDKKRLRDIKVDDEFDKLKKEMGL